MDDSEVNEHRGALAFASVAALLATIWSVKSACTVCGSKLTWNQACLFGSESVCGSCSTKHAAVFYKGRNIVSAGRCCAAHVNQLQDAILKEQAAIDEHEKLRAMSESVILYPKTYHGKVEAPKLCKEIETLFYDQKDEAEIQLKMAALREGCPVVQQVEFIKGTDDSTSYVHSVWKAKGII